MSKIPDSIRQDADKIKIEFERKTGLIPIRFEIKERAEGYLLIFDIGFLTDRFYKILETLLSNNDLKENYFVERTVLRRKANLPWLNSIEAKLYQKVLSESLVVDQHTFESDFLDRYIQSMIGAEDQLLSKNNHVVFGRRGSGKSSILLYIKHIREQNNNINIWISMQTYEHRKDNLVFIDIIKEILLQLSKINSNEKEIREILKKIKAIEDKAVNDASLVNDENLNKIVPEIRRVLAKIISANGELFIFLDDFHVLEMSYQAMLLSKIYSFTRGNKIYLKISAIEIFSKLFDSANRMGLEIGNDIQRITLDYNLTIPDKAKKHIEKIFEAHAHYCGLPNFTVLCNGEKLISRLVWASAGVPRDAVNMLLQAILKTKEKGKTKISLTDINIATAEALNDKKRAAKIDSAPNDQNLLDLLTSIEAFCLDSASNAFLILIQDNNVVYERINKLIDLRFLHIINKSITPDKAGVKYLALILDYGFYVGIRRAKTLSLFKENLIEAPSIKELRKLPKYKYQNQF